MDDDEEDKESTITKSQVKERKRLKCIQKIWDLGQGYSNKKSKDTHDPQKDLDLLLNEIEENLRSIYGDPDIEQLPSKLNSVRRWRVHPEFLSFDYTP